MPLIVTWVYTKVSMMRETVAKTVFASIVEYLWLARDARDNRQVIHEYTLNRMAIARMANSNDSNASAKRKTKFKSRDT